MAYLSSLNHYCGENACKNTSQYEVRNRYNQPIARLCAKHANERVKIIQESEDNEVKGYLANSEAHGIANGKEPWK